MVARILLLVILLVCSAEATPFANKNDLKSAVDNCLAFDETGVACCSKPHDASCDSSNVANRRCGVAGCNEMALWDTSSVTDMGHMFRDASESNADISGWDTSSVTDMGTMFNEAVSYTHLTLPTNREV